MFIINKMTKWATQPSGRMDRSLVLCCSHCWLWEQQQCGRRAVKQAEVQSRCLWFLWEEGCMSSSHFLFPFHTSPVTTFLWNYRADFLNWDTMQLISEGKKITASASRLTCIIWIKTDLLLWVLQFTNTWRSCGNWETTVRLTARMHIYLSVLTYFQNPMEGRSICDSGRSRRIIFSYTIR